MVSSEQQTLEQALAVTETDAAATLRAAGALMRPLRRFRTAAQLGDLHEIRLSMEAAESALATLRQQMATAQEGWSFNAQNYLSTGGYAKEVMRTAAKMGIKMFERDDRMFCYPALLRVIPSERVIAVDRRRERRLRPSVLVNLLKNLQSKPPRFRPEAFLSALYEGYSKIAADQSSNTIDASPVVPLVDIYRLLTLLPGQAKEYSKQEFTRDIYLLHRGDVQTTKAGAKVSFPISRGVRGKTLSVVDETGEQRRYYGIRFTQNGRIET